VTGENKGAAPAAPLARLRGVKQWEAGVIQADGQRWITVTFNWLDDEEPIGVTLDPRDAETLAGAILHQTIQAEMRDLGDRN
jgi:hypothetical protein